MKFKVALCIFSLVSIIQLASSDPPETSWITKQVVVGDEFPAISIGILNNRTEYSIELDTINPICEAGYTCAIYIYLLEMFCQKDNDAYISIEGITLTNKTINIKWCRQILNSDTIKDEFVQIRKATIKPFGDWSNINATISALFTMERPLQTKLVSEEDPFMEFNITDSSFQYNSYFNGTCLDDTGCGVAISIHMNCESTRKSADLQLTTVLMNNETKFNNICSWGTKESQEKEIKVSKYLNNIQQLLLTPLGDWTSSNIVAQVSIHAFHNAGTLESCPESHFDCNYDKCARNISQLLGQFIDLNDNNVIEIGIHCVPWTWICGNDTTFCSNYCNLAHKYCPQIISVENLTSSPPTNSTAMYDGWIRRSILYYSFFVIPLLLILIIFFGTVYVIRIRMTNLTQNSDDHGSTSQSSTTRLSLFGRFNRTIPYQIVREND